MSKLDDLERVEITSTADLRTWLARHHAKSKGIWLVRWKQPDERYVAWPDVVDEVLCFGWIDSLPRKLDATRSMLYVAPRKPKSVWSEINRAKVENLISQGRMQPAGLHMVERAKADGTWETLASSDALEVPPDLAKAFTPTAAANFEAFPKSVKRAILEWINAAKKPETRITRIADTADKAAQNIRANQWRK